VAVLTSGQRRLSSDEVALRAARAATGFERLGIGSGDGVGLYLRNDLAFFEAALGASAVGAYPVAVNWHYSVEEARYVLEDSEAKAVVIHADLLQRVAPAIPAGAAVQVVSTPPEIVAAYGIPEACATVPPGATDWEEWLSQFEPRLSEPARTTLSIIYTSGTTGHPKGVKRPPYSQDELERLTASLAVIFGFTYFEDPSQMITAVPGRCITRHPTRTPSSRSGSEPRST